MSTTAKNPTVSLQSKLKSLLDVRRALSEMDSSVCLEVERKCELSDAEFLDQYYSKNKPVILSKLFSNSFAAKHWTFALLKERYGHETVEIMADRERSLQYERDYDAHRKKILFSDYIELIESQTESNDYYLVANNHLLKSAAFQSVFDDFKWPTILDPATRDGRAFLWLGPAGTVTPLHHDHSNGLLVQVRGRKKISLIPSDFMPYVYNNYGCFSDVNLEQPDVARFPLFQEVKCVDVTLEPGEALFIPVLWWHHVRSLDPSISLSFTNFAFPNEFNIADPQNLS